MLVSGTDLLRADHFTCINKLFPKSSKSEVAGRIFTPSSATSMFATSFKSTFKQRTAPGAPSRAFQSETGHCGVPTLLPRTEKNPL